MRMTRGELLGTEPVSSGEAGVATGTCSGLSVQPEMNLEEDNGEKRAVLRPVCPCMVRSRWLGRRDCALHPPEMCQLCSSCDFHAGIRGEGSCPPHPAGAGFSVRHVPALFQGTSEESEVHSPSHRFHACVLEHEEALRSCSDQEFGASLSGAGLVSAVCC